MEKYQNRYQAGQLLASQLLAFAKRDDVIVLGLPRGGVPVAYEIAKALHVPFDIFIVRKLGVPGHNELAMGAIAMGGVQVLNESIMHELSITQNELESVIAKEQAELSRREMVYRGQQSFPDVKDKVIILADDGVATGATITVAILALQQLHPARIVVAVPVAEESVCNAIRLIADEVICPLTPDQLYAVGNWYEDFSQTEDEEVFKLLKQRFN